MPVYLISKAADPLFALTIGASAALIRIRREEREKHPERAAEIGFGAVFETGKERLGRWWNGEFDKNGAAGVAK
ncbi:hypothetical protein BJX63DRAFT_405306 [Aspergillus granulosus]|uniref:Non-classical export protein 1 n=1 Tax=Aspergillus granulosus TaxID=176169 RepID=A0ABR4H275_9EURO